MTQTYLQSLGLGKINGHVVGIILKEIIRRNITAIRNKQQAHEVFVKEGYGGSLDDLFTDADKKAQEVSLKSLRECFPDAGIIAEEDGLRVPGNNGCKAYFTIDPLDGTKAFVRGQSHGTGSMIALALEGRVLSAYIGDINTQEIYGYRPDSTQVHRITEFNTNQVLNEGNLKDPNKKYMLLRDPERSYSQASQQLLDEAFEGLCVDGGSIGIWLARLWKREVTAAIIPPGHETPWDSTPIIGISRKLGYRFFRPTSQTTWEEVRWTIPTQVVRREHDLLIVHSDDVDELFPSVT